MGTARLYLGLAALGGKLYAAGGQFMNSLSSVEVFDPQTQRLDACRPHEHGAQRLCDGRGAGQALRPGWRGGVQRSGHTAEAFDQQQNRWEAVAPMATALHSCAASAI